MADNPTAGRRQKLLDKYLAGEIDKSTYDALILELQSLASVTESDGARTDDGHADPEVLVTTTTPNRSRGSVAQPEFVVVPGVELGGFQIEARLGRGGMGEVWRARDVIGERTVVIKLLHPEFVHHPEELASVKQMFQRVHNLQHQNICPMFLLGQDDRFGYFVVMKYIDGVTLMEYRRQVVESNGRFSLRDVARVLAPVAKALDYAHGQKIIHCDVKPQNIMIGSNGQSVQLVDFGLAAEIRSSVGRLDSTSIDFGGTYSYMSPEQWRGEVLDGKTDQYSLAVVAYELLAGLRPFQSSDPNVLRMCALTEVPSPIGGVDSTVNDAIRHAMAKSKTERFDSCFDFLKSLCVTVIKASAETPHRQAARPSKSTSPTTTGRPSPKVEEDDVIELLDVVEVPPTAAAIDSPSRQQKQTAAATPKRRPSMVHKRVSEDDFFESPIKRANQKALVWLSFFGIATAIAFVGFTLWLVASFFSTSRTQVADSNGNKSNNTSSGSNAAGGNSAPAEVPLRYRWQPDRGYVYSVKMDIDQDADRVVTLSGELMYSVSTPIVTSVPLDRETTATGTAFVVHPDGYLLTCHHVTDGATKIDVALAGKTYPATVVIDDHEHDLALIHIDASRLPFLPIADSDTVQQGEEIRAMGFPLASVLGENIKATRGTISGINDDEGRKVFQIDAAINPGNSGGPLVNEKAEVVGVIFAKLVEGLGSRVGFATPSNDAKVLLTSQKIAYTNGRAGGKLDGPALVKEVSAATALVTVATWGATGESKGKVSIGCDGVLNPKSWRRSGQPADAGDQFGNLKQLIYSSAGAGPDVEKVETDSLGRIHSVSGRGNLPNFMGHAARLLIEKLPPNRQRDWSYSNRVNFSLEQEQNHFGRMPWGPRFGRGRFGPPREFGGPFGPPGFPNPFSEPTTKEMPGSLRVDYVLGARTNHLQTIQKKIDLKTDQLVGTVPRIRLTGTGNFVMNTLTGVPHELEFSAQLAESEPNQTTSIPIKLTYQFIEERKLPPGLGRPQFVPPPVSAPGRPVEAATPLEVGSKMVCEWAGKWLPCNILSLNDDETVRIHWDGWSDQWDEDVSRSRLRFPPK